MPQRVKVNSGGLGTVEFPEMMPAHEMASHINRHLATKRIPITSGPEMHAPTSGDIQANLPGSVVRPQTWWEKISGDIQESAAGRLFKAGADIQNRLRGSTSEILNTQLPHLGGLTVGDVNDLANAMIVFHGSPHTFDVFDASKIGTGEGAQVYGHGLYFAENPAVAYEYIRTLSDWGPNGVAPEAGSLEDRAAAYVADAIDSQSSDPFGKAMAHIQQQQSPELATKMNEIVRGWKRAGVEFKRTGKMYHVEIPDQHLAKMLDYDAPLGQQEAAVKNQLANVTLDNAGLYAEPVPEMPGQSWVIRKGGGRIGRVNGNPKTLADLDHITAGNVIDASRNGGTQAALSMALQDAGIPGIQYLDQGSRTAGMATYTAKWLPNDAGAQVINRASGKVEATFPSFAEADKWIAAHAPKPTRNFVVFDPSILGEVTRK